MRNITAINTRFPGLCKILPLRLLVLTSNFSFLICRDFSLLGTMRAVHRHVFQLDSAPGQGVVWEWQNDEGSWFPYEMNVCVYLEQAFSLSSPQVDLGPFGYNYGIDFVSQTQINKTTGYQRRIRRCVDSPYPVATTPGPAHSGPTCSCQQCLLNSGTGPITSRYRHSMVNLPGHSSGTTPKFLTGIQGANRNSGLGASLVGFVPYNKPALSGARSMPRLNMQSAGSASQSAAIGGASSAHTASKGTRYAFLRCLPALLDVDVSSMSRIIYRLTAVFLSCFSDSY